MSIHDGLARAQALRAELRNIEKRVENASRHEPITEQDERRMARFQAVCDEAYQAVDRRCPPPLAYEKPRQ